MATLRAILDRHWADCRYTLTRGDDDYHGLVWRRGNPRPKPDEVDVRGLATTTELMLRHEHHMTALSRPFFDLEGLDSLVELHDAVLALREAVPKHLLPDVAHERLNAVAARRERLRRKLVKVHGPKALL